MQKQFPHVLVIASVIGFYGDRIDAIVEKATAAAATNGIRVVRLRFGVMLSRTGGAVAKMLSTFWLGLEGRQRPVISKVVTNLQFTRTLEK
jgi:NAD dependent epimerase/dehydratase family enzyme